MQRVIVFTDGSSSGNPGPGGWGSIVATDESVKEMGGREENTTNNRMELKALYEALIFATDLAPEKIDVYIDSKYVVNGATSWGHGWRKNNWITSGTKTPVLHRDIWEALLNLLDTMKGKVFWHRIGGHIAIPGNERVDTIATDFTNGARVHLYSGPRVSYQIDLTKVEGDASLVLKKAQARKHANTKAYSYVSKVDGVVLIHKTWDECEARVKGNSARYKKAISKEDEDSIVREFSSQ